MNLREIIEAPGFVMAPGIYDSLTAAIVEDAGYDAAYVSGGAASLALTGRPDLGLMTSTEMTEHVFRLRGSTRLPLIVDIDTGYGNELNIRHAIELHRRLGSSAVHIEDQVFPKRCGHLAGKEVVDRNDAVNKVRAAVAAREDDDLLIIGRTDALAVHGIDDAIDRARRFADVGADLVFIEAPESLAHLEVIGNSIDVPLVVNVLSNSRTPLLTSTEYEELGFKLGIYPSMAIGAAASAIAGAARTLMSSGKPPTDGASPAEMFEIVGLSQWLRWGEAVTALSEQPLAGGGA